MVEEKKPVNKRSKNIFNKFIKNKKKRRVFYIFSFFVLLTALLFIFRSSIFVAFVNNKPITRFALIKQLEKESGKATLENIITKELINQEANKLGVVIAKETIQEEVNNIKKIVEAQGTTLDEALSIQGQTLQDLEDNIKIQKTAEEILKSDISVTDDELRTYFDENKELYGDQEFDEIKADLKEQLTQQKLQEKFTDLLDRLRNESDVKYIINF